ncbi:MAG: 50S ribosomal protein L6 [Planctomycetes bacterium]|nr:50S ribosomal protein L6 [Planctomycetota bacterium]MCA8936214.1 50S ribosomal protein L6 [Planctomycetota bacterium]
MSRIGKQPVEIPSGVTVDVSGTKVTVKGSKGELSIHHRPEVTVKVEGSEVQVERKNESKLAKALHGTTRSLINNMIEGVTKGYQKNLDIVGVGWQGKLQGRTLVLQLGFCHTVDFEVPEGLTVNMPMNQRIEVTGIDKQAVGQFAAEVRASRKPEPYKGKGVRYEGEHIVRKAGKSFVGGGK